LGDKKMGSFMDDIRKSMNKEGASNTVPLSPTPVPPTVNRIDEKIKAKINEAKQAIDVVESIQPPIKQQPPVVEPVKAKMDIKAVADWMHRKAVKNEELHTINKQEKVKIGGGNKTQVDTKPETKPISPKDVQTVQAKTPKMPKKETVKEEGIIGAAVKATGGLIGRKIAGSVLNTVGLSYSDVSNWKSLYQNAREKSSAKATVAKPKAAAMKPKLLKTKQDDAKNDPNFNLRASLHLNKPLGHKLQSPTQKTLKADPESERIHPLKKVGGGGRVIPEPPKKDTGGTEHMSADEYRKHAGLKPRKSMLNKESTNHLNKLLSVVKRVRDEKNN